MIHAGRFDGRTAVVTGAAQGIGEAVATGLAKEGAMVALVDRSELVQELSDKLAAGGARTTALLGDLEQYADCSRVMDEAREQLGRIDVLINNVGGTIWTKPYAEYSEDEIQAEVRRSLFPTLWCCRAVLPHMLDQGRGTIVNVSSVATRGVNRAPYAAAKGGVNALTASLALEYAHQGIRVVATAPGGTEAPERRIPRGPTTEKSEQENAWYQEIVDQTVDSSLMKRYGTLEEQAAPILFLASDEASYITGVTLPVAGGDLG
ncbi:1,6-dihydroxycyclohexa-2,4-diene-1-carboxylate dehydrogenase [Pseudonocardia sp. H11422]|uniref:1,6-dihydroxycyclohexa-2,4-diene-1-carboxylate dehydrogenase n=1 Tax=Pseudonocardia sp. H11422 TaxID=2835866 RepID=UPI00202776EF|nr:1,6-dihydroxycyclohexa-2,4-diene-1-carboxylate dehydrogenase [Pseudonocardia sp. H11422]